MDRHAMLKEFVRAASKAHARLAMKARDAVVAAGPDALDEFYARRRRLTAAYDARVRRLEDQFLGELL